MRLSPVLLFLVAVSVAIAAPVPLGELAERILEALADPQDRISEWNLKRSGNDLRRGGTDLRRGGTDY